MGAMRLMMVWGTLGVLGLLGSLGAAMAHEITYDGKICECLGDFDHDNDVDAEDARTLLARFGEECADNAGCDEDLNHNHFVGKGDFQVLLGHWGTCRVEGDVNGDGVTDEDDFDRVVLAQGRACRVDLDGNGRVAGNDLEIAETAWGTEVDWHPRVDIDEDGFLSVTDLLAVFDNLGVDCAADVDGDGLVSCVDLDHVCELGGLDCPPVPDCVRVPVE